jgi:hypothetical protein
MNLKPFTDEFEFGTEIRLLHDRIGLDATAYDKKQRERKPRYP